MKTDNNYIFFPKRTIKAQILLFSIKKIDHLYSEHVITVTKLINKKKAYIIPEQLKCPEYPKKHCNFASTVPTHFTIPIPSSKLNGIQKQASETALNHTTLQTISINQEKLFLILFPYVQQSRLNHSHTNIYFVVIAVFVGGAVQAKPSTVSYTYYIYAFVILLNS